ncbi:MAG TPA: ice-binding family protein [Candidatus Nanopelagicaceae bacterium]
MRSMRAQAVNRAMKPKRILSVIALLGLVVPGISATPSQANTFQPKINLGSSANYVLLAHTAITNGATTIISGTGTKVVGISPGISDAGTVSSIIASGATEFQNGTAKPTLAQSDLQNAIASVSSLTPKVVSANLSLADNATIYPGVYTTPGGAAMSIDQNLILDAKGDSNAIFVFVAPTSFNTSAAITVFLQNGAQASNIYWVVGAGLTLGASTNISGNFLVTAGTAIGASSTLHGRILSQDAVTLGASVVLVS